jgi:hypothetical protein
MKKVLPWVKSNLVTVIAVAIAIIALPVAWYFASSMTAEAAEKANTTARGAYQDVEGASIDYEVPPLSAGDDGWRFTAPPNQELINDVVEVRREVKRQSDLVKESIIDRNSAGKDVLVEHLFPEPAGGESGPRGRVRLTEDMLEAWDGLSERLLEEVGAAQPPEPQELSQRLSALRDRLINETIATRVDQNLSEDERAELNERMAEERRSQYEAGALRATFYANPDGLFGSRAQFDPDAPPPGRDTYLETFWNWQHTSWVERDIIAALASANEGLNAANGPVKRVIAVDVPPWTPGEVSTGDLTQPIDADFSEYFTGRAGGNALYDVRYADVDVIVGAGRVNEVINAFATTNFMTVVETDVTHLGTNPDLFQGFYYGEEPVVKVDMTVETVWVRSWYEDLIPAPVREVMGLPELETAEDADGMGDGAA